MPAPQQSIDDRKHDTWADFQPQVRPEFVAPDHAEAGRFLQTAHEFGAGKLIDSRDRHPYGAANQDRQRRGKIASHGRVQRFERS